MDDANKLRDLYRALDFERPLDIADAKDQQLYVPKLHSTNGYDPISELEDSIEIADRPNSWLFTGHRGVGKSTELRRLAADLRRKGFLVCVTDVGDYLNLAEPINTEILLITLLAALADWSDHELGGTRLEVSYLQRFRDFLQTDIAMTELNFKMPDSVTNAKVILRQTPNFLDRVKTAVDGAPARLWEKVKAFAGQIVADFRLRHGSDKQIVLILDSMEQLRVTGTNANACYDAISNTFDLDGEFLRLDHLHVVYSVPPYLPHLIPRIGSYYGYGLCSLAQVKVFETPNTLATNNKSQPCRAGQALMVNSVQKRYPDVAQLIPVPLLEQLALGSSGSLRDFFRLIRSVCTKARITQTGLPLADDKMIIMAHEELRNEMPLAEEDKEWLRKVHATHGTGLDKIGNLPQLARLFDCGVILNYRNGRNWCDVHYLLHEQLKL